MKDATASMKLTMVVKYRAHGQEAKDARLAPMIRPITIVGDEWRMKIKGSSTDHFQWRLHQRIQPALSIERLDSDTFELSMPLLMEHLGQRLFWITLSISQKERLRNRHTHSHKGSQHYEWNLSPCKSSTERTEGHEEHPSDKDIFYDANFQSAHGVQTLIYVLGLYISLKRPLFSFNITVNSMRSSALVINLR